ncbi:Ribose import ATP-binding protein RbsA [uncultured Roseburia sp.]|uniref:Sugar ABC transporter ATP-binding protein n=1 Tax=Brotonthovivens ammoniilytica TaxID=2981725 RepID=A0ABT2TKQ8_9FIRM|nr:sugar ABC transporter ATP-binding protein [Brotonthovivens ammoniilytica]MCU6762793.1 sugar ABC transporter ATP-binding protein [Brotonthovivens ammoniilytica]SCI89134.1 Ribose import ATP-binding protein RbsA [uncultured Roseburia sp.]
MAELAIKMSNIVKSFGGAAPVLKNVTLEVKTGEIHGLLGENGAGKSTLMNILGGVIPMDSGNIELFGKEAAISSTKESQEYGVAFIHQELNVVNDMPVYENMFLGYELRNKWGFLLKDEMCRQSQEVFDRMNVSLNPADMVGDLTASSKQILEIAKSLLRKARIIIMDEPTTSLSVPEIENVFRIMRTLTADGVTIIFISHKLGEVVEFCDQYTVLRNGEKISSGSIEKEDGTKITPEEIAKMMVGREVQGLEIYKPRKTGEVVMKVENLSAGKYFQNISFEVHKGEILGFTGLLGDGKEELVRCLFGDIRSEEGKVFLRGEEVKIRSPKQAAKKKIGFLPSNRKENAIIKDLSITENMTIVALDKCIRGIYLNHKKENEVASQYKDVLHIKLGKFTDLITSLSGGNQQKVILAKWMYAMPDVMILCNPTQGVDIGAKNEIYNEIFEIAKAGTAVIVTSGEAQEIMKLCDRVKVMYHGKLNGTLEREQLSEEELMILSTGANLNKGD